MEATFKTWLWPGNILGWADRTRACLQKANSTGESRSHTVYRHVRQNVGQYPSATVASWCCFGLFRLLYAVVVNRTGEFPTQTGASNTDAGTAPTPAQPQAPPQASSVSADDIAAIQQEVGDRNVLYLRTRLVYQYDHKLQVGDVTTNRLRVKWLYAFGPHQRLGFSVLVPVIHKDSPSGAATGSGDTEVVVGRTFYRTERGLVFRFRRPSRQVSAQEQIGIM